MAARLRHLEINCDASDRARLTNVAIGMTRANIQIGNNIGELARVTATVERFGDANALPQQMVNDLNVTLDEVLSNIISYAYTDSAEHHITIDLSFDGECAKVVVEDDGVPFDPLQVPHPNPVPDLLERKVGGLGIHFIRTLMDDCAYVRSDGRNILTLTKRVT